MNNHTMMTDEYELTMSESYFLDGKKDEVVYFDAFFRSIPFESGYAIMAGGREIVDYIQNLKFNITFILIKIFIKFTYNFI